MEENNSFSEAYLKIVKDVYNNGEICNSKGKKTKEILGYKFCINNPLDRLLFIKNRNWSLRYCIGEIFWYWSASNKLKWIQSYSNKSWSSISDDKLTLNSAYGSRIFKKHPKIGKLVQWKYVIDKLRSDKESRQAVIHIRTPIDSMTKTLDMPCTLSIQYFIRNNKLHCIVNMRSSDVIRGISYDVPSFTFFQERLARELKVDVGKYMHISNSLHIYEKDFDLAEKILEENSANSIQMPEMPEENITKNIKLILKYESEMRKNKFNFHSNINSYWNDQLQIIKCHYMKLYNINGVSKELHKIKFKAFVDLFDHNVKDYTL